MDYRTVLYGPVYQTQGVEARLTTASGIVHDGLLAIDRTAGVALGGTIEIETLRPVATVLAGDLGDRGISVDDLDEGTVALNGAIWKIIGHRDMPSPGGLDDGEIYLLLEGTGNA